MIIGKSELLKMQLLLVR